MNIQEFLGSIGKGGVAFTSDFKVFCTAPGAGADAREISMRIEQVNIPGRSVAVQEFVAATGSKFKIGVGVDYEPVSFTVILSSDMSEKEFFESWIDKVVGDFRTNDSEDFRIGYYDSYKGSVVIMKYDNQDNAVKRWECVDAYPVSIGMAAELTWSEKDVLKMRVEIAYRYIKETTA